MAMVQRHKQVITLMALAFSICVLTSLAQVDNVSQAQVGGLGVALLLLFLMCMKGSEMFARSHTPMARNGNMRRSRMNGSSKRRQNGMRNRARNKESFYGGMGTQMQESMPVVQASPIPPMSAAGTRETRYYREGTDIKNAMMLQNLFNFTS